jgi:hypothetical protein
MGKAELIIQLSVTLDIKPSFNHMEIIENSVVSVVNSLK